jgi:peroxiredoxin
LQDDYEKIKAEGAELVVMSSDTVAASKRTVDKEGLKFTVLADSEKKTIADYNVVDPNNKHIARPATYIIDQNGIVAWTFLDARLGHRIPTEDILDQLGK